MPRNRPLRRRRRRRTPSPWSGTLRLSAIFAILIAINVYILFFRGGTSLRALLKASSEPRPPTALVGAKRNSATAASAKTAQKVPATVEAPTPRSDDEGRVVHGIVAPSETPIALLRRYGVSGKTATVASEALGRLVGSSELPVAVPFALMFDRDDRLRTVEILPAATALWRLDRRGESWRATRESGAEVRTQASSIVIESTFGAALDRAGEARSLGSQIAALLASSIDFHADVRSGDRLRVLVEKVYLDGKFLRDGRVLAATFEGRIGMFQAYWFEAEPGLGAYYNERGEPVAMSLLRTPLKWIDLPAGAAKRSRPVLRSEGAQLGADYVAPLDSPVWAFATGRVVFKGVRGPSGNCVIVAHPGGMETIYTHLARFSRGFEVGDVVTQKQIVGFVGMSGLPATTHLHFRVKMGNRFIDPMRLRPARGASISARDFARFVEAIRPRREQLAQLDAGAPNPTL